MLRCLSLGCGLAALILLPSAVMGLTDYTITGIAPVAGDVFSTAYAVNNNGEVIGMSYDDSITVSNGTASITGDTPVGLGDGFFFLGSTTTVLPAVGTNAKGKSASMPIGINDSGEIVGQSTSSSNPVGFTYIGGVLTNLSTTAFGPSIPIGVNNSGVLVATGQSISSGNISGASPILFNGSAVTLGNFAGGSDPTPRAINAAGIAVGSDETSTSEVYHAAMWNSSGAITDLGTLPGVTKSAALAINSAGNVVGWSGNTPADNAPLAFNTTAANGSFLLGLNYAGISIGELSEYISGDAFLYSASTQKMTDLGTLGGAFSMAQAINDSDDIVGTSIDSAGDFNAFLYEGTTMVNLNTLLPSDSGWTLIDAQGINNNGDIVGWGEFDGNFEAFLLTPGGTITGTNGNGNGNGNGNTGNTGTPTAVPLPSAAWSSLCLLAGLGLISKVRRGGAGSC